MLNPTCLILHLLVCQEVHHKLLSKILNGTYYKLMFLHKHLYQLYFNITTYLYNKVSKVKNNKNIKLDKNENFQIFSTSKLFILN